MISLGLKDSSLSSPQHNGSEQGTGPKSHLMLIEDMARKLLMEDEVAAVLRHCTRVRGTHGWEGLKGPVSVLKFKRYAAA